MGPGHHQGRRRAIQGAAGRTGLLGTNPLRKGLEKKNTCLRARKEGVFLLYYVPRQLVLRRSLVPRCVQFSATLAARSRKRESCSFSSARLSPHARESSNPSPPLSCPEPWLALLMMIVQSLTHPCRLPTLWFFSQACTTRTPRFYSWASIMRERPRFFTCCARTACRSTSLHFIRVSSVRRVLIDRLSREPRRPHPHSVPVRR